MDNCNYCDEINSKPLNKGMNATATWKTNTLNKKWVQVFPGLYTVACKEKNVFLQRNTS